MKIQIAHLYSEFLNLYGDRGNIASLTHRLLKRGIECELTQYDLDDKIDFENTDIVYLGGGTDKDQITVLSKLLEYKDEFKNYIENGGVALCVCGGFELLGKYLMIGNEKKDALDILDIYTIQDKERHIGNIVIHSDIIDDKIVGFENHSSLICLNGYDCLGKVEKGFGNDGKSRLEGLVYKNLIATSMHGPLLPKNPKLCDHILSLAIKRRFGEFNLCPLDDTLENNAHDYAVKRFSQKN